MPLLDTINISLEMYHPNDLVLVHAVQGEYYSRQVTASLFQNGAAYTIPAGAIAVIRYRKPDGNVGFYDFDPAGNRVVTISQDRKKVIFALAAEMCDVPGRVLAHIDLYSQDSIRLSAFYFYVDVEKAASDVEVASKLNTTGLQTVLANVIGNIYTPGDATTGAVIDNTLAIPGAVADAKAVGDRLTDQDTKVNNSILIQNNQPADNVVGNKIWIDADSYEEGTEVSEMDDIALPYSSNRNYSINDYVNYQGHIYRCISPIVNSGTWNSAKWKKIILCEELSRILNQLE